MKSALLVSSPLHLLRARLAFETAGVRVFPVQGSRGGVWDLSGAADRLWIFQQAIHEYIGLVFYRIQGWIRTCLRCRVLPVSAAHRGSVRYATAFWSSPQSPRQMGCELEACPVLGGHHGSSLAFLTELRRAFAFPVKRLQCDHGHEFSFAFVLGVEAAGIRGLVHSAPAPVTRPTSSSGAGGSIRSSSEPATLPAFRDGRGRVRNRETRDNYERFSLALHGRTLAEKLAAFLPPLQVA
jgi:hypothetical protein